MRHYDTSNDTSTVIFAFLAGAFIGAGVAMLLTPRSGAATRRLLSNYAEEAKDQMEAAIETGKDYLQGGIDRGKDYLESAQDMIRGR